MGHMMRLENRFFDDIARVVQGAAGVAAGLRQEVEQMVNTQLERLVVSMDMVSRDEFEALRAMALKALSEQEALAGRLARAEAALAALQSARAKSTAAPASAPQPLPASPSTEPTKGA
jgi:BMFP domain-containing protein YqiC